ncbi:hypothetical protein C8R42DRAFT_646837 [Lentinula raphanica]|nr:hypothetical protein C8R42DRAFT_646837 [Lentinula raphanica]
MAIQNEVLFREEHIKPTCTSDGCLGQACTDPTYRSCVHGTDADWVVHLLVQLEQSDLRASSEIQDGLAALVKNSTNEIEVVGRNLKINKNFDMSSPVFREPTCEDIVEPSMAYENVSIPSRDEEDADEENADEEDADEEDADEEDADEEDADEEEADDALERRNLEILEIRCRRCSCSRNPETEYSFQHPDSPLPSERIEHCVHKPLVWASFVDAKLDLPAEMGGLSGSGKTTTSERCRNWKLSTYNFYSATTPELIMNTHGLGEAELHSVCRRLKSSYWPCSTFFNRNSKRCPANEQRGSDEDSSPIQGEELLLFRLSVDILNLKRFGLITLAGFRARVSLRRAVVLGIPSSFWIVHYTWISIGFIIRSHQYHSIILGILIFVSVNQDHEYIGARYWYIPNAPFVGGFAAGSNDWSHCYCQLCLRITAGETKNTHRRPSREQPNLFSGGTISLLVVELCLTIYPRIPIYKASASQDSALANAPLATMAPDTINLRSFTGTLEQRQSIPTHTNISNPSRSDNRCEQGTLQLGLLAKTIRDFLHLIVVQYPGDDTFAAGAARIALINRIIKGFSLTILSPITSSWIPITCLNSYLSHTGRLGFFHTHV